MLIEPAKIARRIAPIETRRIVLTMAFSQTIRFEGIGDALLRLDPKCDSLAPERNFNHVWNLGVEVEPTEAQIDQIAARYRLARIPHWFFILSPGIHAAKIAWWLTVRELCICNEWDVLFAGIEDALEASLVLPIETDYVIRRIRPVEIASLKNRGFPMDSWPPDRWGRLLDLIRRPEFDLFLAFDRNDSDTPVGASLLYVDNALGWLGMAATLPAYRNRGIQNALIAARVRRAAERKCRGVYAETDSAQSSGSLRNLERRGFQRAYVRPVYNDRATCSCRHGYQERNGIISHVAIQRNHRQNLASSHLR
jgi:GNAT superfamily N-acetyltransferase